MSLILSSYPSDSPGAIFQAKLVVDTLINTKTLLLKSVKLKSNSTNPPCMVIMVNLALAKILIYMKTFVHYIRETLLKCIVGA
jgi:hypothetical protein